MQCTDTQVMRSIEALKQASGEDVHVVDERAERSDVVDVSRDVLDHLTSLPSIRRDRTDEVRTRLADGSLPNEAQIADKLVGRLVCDRLR